MSEQKINETIRRAALSYLARRDYSLHELEQKLRKKGHASENISSVIADLMQDNLINEQRFTENYIQWRRAKGYGPLRIAMELQARGITREMIAEQLEITDNAWFQHAQKVWQKYFKGKTGSDFKLRARQIRFLQYKGFTQEQIESVFETR